MTALILAHKKISFPLPLAAARAATSRAASFLAHPALAALSASALTLGALLYVVMLLASFDLGMRVRDASLQIARESEDVKRMEVRERERDAQFATRHRAFLDGMQEITTLRYVAPGSTAVSEASRTMP